MKYKHFFNMDPANVQAVLNKEEDYELFSIHWHAISPSGFTNAQGFKPVGRPRDVVSFVLKLKDNVQKI